MGLNPSNGIAARANPGKTIFANLARRTSDDEPAERNAIFKTVDDAVTQELIEAGIVGPDGVGDYGNYMRDEWQRKANNGCYKEVPSSIFAAKYGWTFDRQWYYYAAAGPGIPPDRAEEFHKDWGTHVRVEGHCGCPSPLEWCHGFAVSSYHIDTQEGLNAFVKLLASIYRA
jgi:hypothetical protein